MLHRLVIASAALAAFALSVTAHASSADQERPRLKASATVTGDIVRIGDLIAHAGIVANVPIFRSPDLGDTGVVSAQAVLAAVRAHALIGLDPGDVQEITVTRASRTISAQQIEDAVASALSAQFALGQPKDLALQFEDDVQAVHVEPKTTGEPRVSHISYDRRSTRFDAVVAIPSRRPLQLSGHVTAMEEVATVARGVTRGHVLKQEDVIMAQRPRRETPSDAITDPARAIGLAVRHTMQPGRPLRGADLMKPMLVHHDETVMLMYQVPGISLTVRGRATESGAEGDVIGVLNEETKRVVHGVVISAGRVMIVTGATRLASAGSGAPATGSIGRIAQP